MPNLIAVAGYISPARKGVSSVLTLDGLQFEVNEEEIKKQFPLDTSKEGAVRIFINPDAALTVSMKASQLFAANRTTGSFKYYKYHDDYHPKDAKHYLEDVKMPPDDK